MKKFIFILLVTIMLLSLFACGAQDTGQDKGQDQDNSPSPTPEGNCTEEPSDPPAQEKVDEDLEKPDEKNDTDNSDDPEETNATSNPVDINPVTSSKEAPAKIGDWQETKRYSTVDSKEHTIYYRIRDIVRYNDEVQSALDAWNDADHLMVFDPLESDDLEYCLIKYEAYYPEDFPQHEWGITNVDVGFQLFLQQVVV